MTGKNITLSHPPAVNRLKDIAAEIERLHALSEDDGGLDETQEEYWADLVRESAEVDAHRKALEREADRQRIARITVPSADSERRTPLRLGSGSDRGELDRDILGEPDSIEARRFRDPWNLSEIRTFDRSREEVGAELRARALSAIEQMRGMNQARREGATKIIEEFDNERGDISKLALATSSPDYLRAFAKAARGATHAFTPEEARAVDRAMSLTDNAGGYLIPFQLDPTVIITSDGSFNQIRQIARQVVATGDVWNGVSSGAVTWSFQPEGTEASDGSTTFAQPAITIRKAQGFVPISIEALQDEQNVAQEVGRLLTFGKESLEAQKFVTGVAASNEPVGLVTALVAAGGAVVVASTSTDVFQLADIYKTQGALPARYRARASWLANNLTYNLTRQFTVAGGADVWERLQADRPGMLLGKSAYEAEAMDGVVTQSADNYMLAFGDFDNYVIADRVGTTVEFIPHLFGTTGNFPTGQRGWYAYYRTGAGVVNSGGFRLLNVT